VKLYRSVLGVQDLVYTVMKVATESPFESQTSIMAKAYYDVKSTQKVQTLPID